MLFGLFENYGEQTRLKARDINQAFRALNRARGEGGARVRRGDDGGLVISAGTGGGGGPSMPFDFLSLNDETGKARFRGGYVICGTNTSLVGNSDGWFEVAVQAGGFVTVEIGYPGAGTATAAVYATMKANSASTLYRAIYQFAESDNGFETPKPAIQRWRGDIDWTHAWPA